MLQFFKMNSNTYIRQRTPMATNIFDAANIGNPKAAQVAALLLFLSTSMELLTRILFQNSIRADCKVATKVFRLLTQWKRYLANIGFYLNIILTKTTTR